MGKALRRRFAGFLLTAAIFLQAGFAAAAVERVEILERGPLAGGAAFGATGAYEKLRGRAWFALDPRAPANAAVTDLALAPRDGRGLVVYSADFLMLRPVVPDAGNGTLLYEVNNRGTFPMLAQLDEAPVGSDPTTAAALGNGFLPPHGFTLASSAC